MRMRKTMIAAVVALMATGIAAAAGAKPLNAMHTVMPSSISSNSFAIARDFFNAPIEFDFPYLGNVGSCNIQTHSNGWARVNIDRWEFAPCDNFSNGVATVVVNGQTNTWTILAPDKPLYRFGRYYCGFVREDRPNGNHAIYMSMFFDGVMIGAEHLRRDFKWQTHTWTEFDDIPKGMRQIGGGMWEAGFLTYDEAGANWVDVNQMVFRHGQKGLLPFELRKWLKKASESDIRAEWDKIQDTIKAFYDLPSESNSDDARKESAVNKLKGIFWDVLLAWRINNAKTYGGKYAVLSARADIERIQQKCNEARNDGRGSHAWADWGECLENDLLEAWLLPGEDAACWNAVANMKGQIGKHQLEFSHGFATADLVLSEEQKKNGAEPLLLYKVKPDFYRHDGAVYAKVVAAEPGYCYMPVGYTPPTYVVKVDCSGNIVKWYPYPTKAKTLRSFLGPVSVTASQATSLGSPYGGEPANAELLYEKGDISLFAGETDMDIAFNAEPERGNDWCHRNSLFLKRRKADGTAEWRLVLTSGSDWKKAEGMGEFGRIWVDDIRSSLNVVRASLTRDGRTLWMVCNPPCSSWFDVVCRFDLRENTLAVLTDGDSADEQPDGTILVKGKKTYLSDENGEPLGARWYDLWMTPDGKVVRKGRLWSADELANEPSDNAN